MVYALLIRSTLLRTQLLTPSALLSLTSTRNKSITQAIESGKRRAWDKNPTHPRPGTSNADNGGDEGAGAGPRLTRYERRRAKFGTTPAYEKKARESKRNGGDGEGEGGQRAFRTKSRWQDVDRTSSGEGRYSGSKSSTRFGRVDMPTGRGNAMLSRREHGEGRGEMLRRMEMQGGKGGRGGRDGNPRPERISRSEGSRWREGGEARLSHKPTNTWSSPNVSNTHGRRRDPDWRESGGDDRGDYGRTSETYKSSEGAKSGSGRSPYVGRDDRGDGGTSERKPYARKSTDGGGGSGRRAYAPRSSERIERTSDRRPYGRTSTEGGDRGRTPDTARPFQSGPDSLPYTTAASEFIYGHSSVLAAIKANRRKLYKLYVHSRGTRDGFMAKVRAHKLFEITTEVGDEYLRAMDKASAGRPHNGIVLESSPLPVPPITALKTPSIEDQSFGVVLDTQSAEDTLVNGKNELYSYKSAGWRHPLILYVDGVLDEGNLGAMARSAYFLGVEAIVTSTHHIAPWSHIALKASAGAAEAIPIFKVGKPADFLSKSSQADWKIYASNAVPPAPPSIQSPTAETPETETSKIVYTFTKSSKRLDADHCPVAEHPTILMMGAEATGLKYSLSSIAHYNVGIPHGRDVNEVGVDSLNVSAAASLLCYEMLQKPKAKTAPASDETLF